MKKIILKIIRKILDQNHLDAEGGSWETKSSGRAAVDPLMMAIRYNRTKGVIQLLMQKTKIKPTQKHIALILKRPDASLLLQEIMGVVKVLQSFFRQPYRGVHVFFQRNSQVLKNKVKLHSVENEIEFFKVLFESKHLISFDFASKI